MELNPNRINSASLHIKGNKKYTDIIINEIRKENDLKVYKLNDYKIGITYKGVNKINAIKNYFQDNDVIFVTDYEEDISKHKNNIQLYSVGKNDIFNSKCDKTYDNIESVLNDIGGIK